MRSRILAALLALHLGALAALYATWPGSPDQYELSYLGWRMLEGDAPYVDFIDVNWPGSFWLHQLSVFLLGIRIHGWRFVDFGLMLLGLASLVDLLRRLWGGAAAAWAAVLYPALYITAWGPWFSGQPDLVGAHFVFVALWFHWRAWEAGRVRWQIGAGLAVAAATLVKPTMGIVLPLLALHGLCFVGERRILDGAFWRHALLAGAVACVGLGVAFFVLLLQGATPEAIWEVVFVANSPAYRMERAGPSALWDRAWHAHLRGWHWIAGAALASCVWSLRSSWRSRRSLAAATLFPLVWLGGLVSYAVQNTGYTYHLGVCFSAMVAMTFAGLGALTECAWSSRRGIARAAAIGVLAIPVAGTAAKLGRSYLASLEWLAGRRSDADFYASFPAGDGLDMSQVLEVLPRVERALPLDAPILVFGQASIINFLARRAQPTRFYYAPTLWDVRLPAETEERWARWLRDDLLARPPALCFVDRENLYREREHSHPSLAFLRAYLGERYRVVGRVAEVAVYAPGGQTPGPAALDGAADE